MMNRVTRKNDLPRVTVWLQNEPNVASPMPCHRNTLPDCKSAAPLSIVQLKYLHITASRPPVSTLGSTCVPPTVNYLQYLATGSTLTAVGPFQLPAPAQSGTLSRISSETRPSVQTPSDVCLKRICSLDASALSALEVLDDNRTLQIYLLNYLLTPVSDKYHKQLHTTSKVKHVTVHTTLYNVTIICAKTKPYWAPERGEYCWQSTSLQEIYSATRHGSTAGSWAFLHRTPWDRQTGRRSTICWWHGWRLQDESQMVETGRAPPASNLHGTCAQRPRSGPVPSKIH